MARDLLDVAADAAERLEREGLVACGRRVNGITRVDFWTRSDGKAYSLTVDDTMTDLDELVSLCLAKAGMLEPPGPSVVKH